jgi:hypothetical protein
MTYLQEKPGSGVWRYRRKIPDDIRATLNRGEFYTVSLGTYDRSVARAKYGPVHAECERIFIPSSGW